MKECTNLDELIAALTEIRNDHSGDMRVIMSSDEGGNQLYSGQIVSMYDVNHVAIIPTMEIE